MDNLTTLRMLLLLSCMVWVTLPLSANMHEIHTLGTTISPLVDVTGTVTDLQGEPLIGVNVLVQGTNQGTSTDVDGNCFTDQPF